jgi:hypothetical protein
MAPIRSALFRPKLRGTSSLGAMAGVSLGIQMVCVAIIYIYKRQWLHFKKNGSGWVAVAVFL